MKNKILSIFLIVILISCCFISNSVFASAVVPTELPDEILSALKKNAYYGNPEYDYLVYNYDSMFAICFIKKDNDLKWRIVSKGVGSYWFIANKLFASYEYLYDASTYKLTSSTYSETRDWMTTHKGGFVNSNLMFLSSFNIYRDTDYNEIFFQCPLVAEITLAEVMRQAGEQATQEVGQTILVVIVATVGLIIFVIGLKKGLIVLMSGLKR